MPERARHKPVVEDMAEDSEEARGLDKETEELDDLDVEAPEADAVEQHLSVRPQGEDPSQGSLPMEADPADAYDQARIVTLDEDEYR